MYCTGNDLQNKLLLGMNSGCVYFVTDGNYMGHSNSQVKNPPVIIYSLGDSRVLNWKKGDFIN